MAERLVRARPSAAEFAVRLSSARPQVRALWFQVCMQTVTSAGCDFVSCEFHATAREQLFPDLLGKGDFGQNSDAFFFCG